MIRHLNQHGQCRLCVLLRPKHRIGSLWEIPISNSVRDAFQTSSTENVWRVHWSSIALHWMSYLPVGTDLFNYIINMKSQSSSVFRTFMEKKMRSDRDRVSNSQITILLMFFDSVILLSWWCWFDIQTIWILIDVWFHCVYYD